MFRDVVFYKIAGKKAVRCFIETLYKKDNK